ncbi:MAG: transglycosylase SLT domain-containing protein [Nanoarchaeota archaeon]
MVVKKLTSIFLTSLLTAYLGLNLYKNNVDFDNTKTTSNNSIKMEILKDNYHHFNKIIKNPNCNHLKSSELESILSKNIDDGLYINITSVDKLDNLQKQKDAINELDINTVIHYDGLLYKHLSGPFTSIDQARESAKNILSNDYFKKTVKDLELGIVNVNGGNYKWIDIVKGNIENKLDFFSNYNYMVNKLEQKGYPLEDTLEIIKNNVDKYNNEVKEGHRKTPKVEFNLASAIAYIESTYDPSSVAHGIKRGKRVKLGQGLFQLTLDTAIDIIKNDSLIQEEFYNNGLIDDNFKKNLSVYLRHGNKGNGRTALNKLRNDFQENLLDSNISSRLGVCYIGNLLNKFDDDLVKMAAAYNAGPRANIKNVRGLYHWQDPINHRYQETRDYVAKVFDVLGIDKKYN